MEENKEDLGDPTEEPFTETESDVDEIINGDSNGVEQEDDKSSSKKLLILIGIVIAAFVIIIGSFYVFKHFSGPTGATTLDDMHQMNVEREESDKNYVYNGFSFVFLDGLWYTQVQRGNVTWNIPLHFGPKDLEEVEIKGKINDSFKKDEIYITFDPTEKPLGFVALASAELSLNLAKGIGVIPIAACLNNKSDACEGRSIIDCESGEATIYIKQDNETKVILDDNCVIIQGQEYGLIKATDRFLLQWYRIMK